MTFILHQTTAIKVAVSRGHLASFTVLHVLDILARSIHSARADTHSTDFSQVYSNMPETYRLRDPVHGLIVFEKSNRVDQLAWRLINTPEFQRLRRIRQLGVTEFTFIGATHTRFSHSIGVFHTARHLVYLLKTKLIQDEFNQRRAEVALFAALLHDVGHGPFSHAFEDAQKSIGNAKHHEDWTAEIITMDGGNIKKILSSYDADLPRQVAELLRADTPSDIYHSIVSSSFDADRLDYLRRDRMMTGSKAGAIDFDWLVDNLRVEKFLSEQMQMTMMRKASLQKHFALRKKHYKPQSLSS